MKKLDLNQMEQVSGDGCGRSTGYALAGLAITAAAGGPFTWWLAAAITVEAIAWADACGNSTEW